MYELSIAAAVFDRIGPASASAAGGIGKSNDEDVDAVAVRAIVGDDDGNSASLG